MNTHGYYKGLFDLNTPQDLLRKLKHDYQRIIQSPTDMFAAFDFFVTAPHNGLADSRRRSC